MNLILALLRGINIGQVILWVYQNQGREAAKRMLTPPSSFVKSTCAKTGADFNTVMAERDQAVEEELDFIEKLLNLPEEDLSVDDAEKL